MAATPLRPVLRKTAFWLFACFHSVSRGWDYAGPSSEPDLQIRHSGLKEEQGERNKIAAVASVFG